MFFQRDYILRMIEMMGDLMRRIRELVNEISQIKLLDEACHTHTGLSLETAQSLTAQSLQELLQPVPRLMMSEILYARAEGFSLPEDEKDELLHKSLYLLASLWEEGPLCELRAERLAQMKERLLPRLCAQELLSCARFFLEAERFTDMEDALFQAMEALPPGFDREILCQEGVSMLTHAASAKPEALAFAHTSREELLLSADELRVLDPKG